MIFPYFKFLFFFSKIIFYNLWFGVIIGSCNPDLGMDVTDLFKYLTGYHRQVSEWVSDSELLNIYLII
jgi:hypothetical protein